MNLSAEHISVTLSGVDIVKDISLHVENGQFVGLIGPNGCGKSTLLKSIYKVIKPQKGFVFLGHKDVLNSSTRMISKEMGVVGQFNELSFDFTVHEMVMMGRTPHKHLMESDNRKDYQIVADALNKVNLSEYADRSYLTLSGGEKQRVILARAIAQQPQFLILDEPTNHLDIKYQLQILKVVKSLNIGVLAALHDLTMATTYCDILYVIKQGQIMASGKPEEILTKELIEMVYEIDCEVYSNPITGDMAITYIT
ncbi:ABC transporter ATP-binding protein [Lysinibacillus pakistanensis]|uniref:ABC transporter ATP-binding protein n=1 Tax=Lysinibacillus pakistanensis TaxID=759811 RepID=A0AAX3X005_9BACI|nr:ABC transporter ATP-binding protein [Lysinibacillus pakistanensis]MDM5232830.1 ABC transporter ATP-binding protein [Lysinibacillus pakistanensis]WHY48327.1 ABC transporter ATP-binding protein [Lysinibacillus pakistanensis]WHY53340.1 ABC transporter ATP-binding protein [Lysinibacillus pakistanensis]